jgi:choline dehydrogenase-like flavoprotein
MVEEVLIVGSGAAGVAAALGLVDHGIRPTIIDVGGAPPPGGGLAGNFYELQKQRDMFDVMVGEDFERVRCRSRFAFPLPAKLTAPRLAFVTRHAAEYQPLQQRNFMPVRSFATGGLANAWGAGLYRGNDLDLAGFAIKAADLTKHFDRLSAEIGISGTSDDLDPFFGPADGLQLPLRLSKKAESLLAAYRRRRAGLNGQGIYVGRPRLGVLSRSLGDRAPCDYSNLEFWEPNLPFIYTPRWTLNRLVVENRLAYRQGLLVESWSREEGRIIAHCRDVASGAETSFSTRILVLAAGAIGSARLALASNRDYRTTLALLDNAALQFPLIMPRFIGTALETDCFGLTQLNLVYQASPAESPLQASILEITSPAKSEFFASLPLAASDNLRMIRYLVPSMMVMQLFFPAGGDDAARLSLLPDGTLRIDAGSREQGAGSREQAIGPPASCRRLIKALRGLGAWTHSALLVKPTPGQNAIHYAGTLPMSDDHANEYHCDRFCQLHGQPNVYVVDGSVFPRVPAKNLSFTMMANAMRVAEHLAQRLKTLEPLGAAAQ